MFVLFWGFIVFFCIILGNGWFIDILVFEFWIGSIIVSCRRFVVKVKSVDIL